MQDDWDDEDGPGIDFKFDGDGHMGPLAPKYERRIMDKFRKMVQSIIEGGETAPLSEALQELFSNFDKAIKACEKSAAKDPDGGALELANIEGYNSALDAIEEMDEALENENYVSLQEGFTSLQEAMSQINLWGGRRTDPSP